MKVKRERYLDIWQLGKRYPAPNGKDEHVVVSDFDLKIDEGEFVSIIGHSGCGKSTVLSIVAGLVPSSDGVVILAGREVTGPGPDRGVVFQSPSLFEWLTAYGNVAIGVDAAFSKQPSATRRKIVEHHLALVGLKEAMHKKPAELSLGMRQRVGLARAFALNPKVLLLDEPFGMLDSLTRMELQQVLIDAWAKDQKTALMVTHDVDEALFLSDRIVMMTSGPNARVGEIMEVPFERPRERVHVMEDPRYDGLRARLVGFLEEQAHPPVAEAVAAVADESATTTFVDAST